MDGRAAMGLAVTTELQSILRTANTLPSKTILAPDGSPYLTRYLIKGQFALDEDEHKSCSSIYLHQFHRPDNDRDLHSHPWPWSSSVILHGSYLELRSTASRQALNIPADVRRYGVGDVNAFRPGDYHTITDVAKDTWTLFTTGPVDRSWYFWVPGKGPTHWREYLTERERQRAYRPGMS